MLWHGFWWMLVAMAVKKHYDGVVQVNRIHRGGGGELGISTLDLDI